MNALRMPLGYTLIRFGLFRWAWKHEAEGHLSVDYCFTAKGAMEYAARHAALMAKHATPAPVADCSL